MINKQSLWLVTLLSLVLLLGIYYVTLPNELLSSTVKTDLENKEVEVNVSEGDMLVALRVERDEKIQSTMKELESVLTSVSSSADDKNNAFEELKVLNLTIGREDELEEMLKKELGINAFVEINKNSIKVVVNSKEHNATIANNIMRSIQKQFEDKVYITVKFEGK